MSLETPAGDTDPHVAALTRFLGRPLRVLHIGNIANNAYNNARIQRQYGIEADVMCHDYYHVMGTPEWEDGGLTTPVNPMLPDWWASNLQGFKRPSWYVQGPLHLCIEYLDARARKQSVRASNAAIAIELAYAELLRAEASRRGQRHPGQRHVTARYGWPSPLRTLFDDWCAGAPGVARRIPTAFRMAAYILFQRTLTNIDNAPQVLRSIPSRFSYNVVWPLLAGAVRGTLPAKGLALRGYAFARLLAGRDLRDNDAVARRAAAQVPEDVQPSWGGALRESGIVAWAGIVALVLCPLVPLTRYFVRKFLPTDPVPSVAERAVLANAILDKLMQDDPSIDKYRAELRDTLVNQSLLFAPVLKHYDIIQGYSIDGFIPLVNGHPRFTSYEHGTLRELPFEDSLVGTMCRVAYRQSPAIFITNTDVLPSVDRLGLDKAAVHYLPHAFDDKKLTTWRDARPHLCPSPVGVTFFSPTRQHWRDENPSLTKGNDVMLRAAGQLWAEGHRFKLRLVEWGTDVGASKALISELGFSEAVEWVPPMGKQDLWSAYCSCHAVLDQFTLPALGGVGFETLALGQRLITRTHQPTLRHFFGEAPPVLGADSIADVANSMRTVLSDPADVGGIGKAGRQWIETWHSAGRTVSIQAKVYWHLMGLREAAEPAGVGASG
ncbi:MAG: glycosyltransferase [Gammaproteobacteria bacterium]|nr:glycosyltransferase [Gammaproteobacteria bacterium]